MVITLIKKSSVLKSKLKSLIGYATIVFAIIKFKKAVSKCKTLKEFIYLTYNFQFIVYNKKFFRFGVFPLQVKGELDEFFKFIIKTRPKIIFECGTAHGGNLFLFSRLSTKDSLIISVDLPMGQFGGGYPSWKIPFYKSFASYHQKIVLIRDDSHKILTHDRVKKALMNQKIDVVFIDGDHTYSGVKKDYNMYKKFVKPGGFMVFHDIVPHANKRVGVPQFWREIRQKYEYKEFVEDWNQQWGGIGLIFIK